MGATPCPLFLCLTDWFPDRMMLSTAGFEEGEEGGKGEKGPIRTLSPP